MLRSSQEILHIHFNESVNLIRNVQNHVSMHAIDFTTHIYVIFIYFSLQQIYRNTSHLIAFEIDTGFTDHKDLALTYYPSEYEFYWFVARTYTQIQSYTKKKKIHPVSPYISYCPLN